MAEPAYALPREKDGYDWPAQGEWTYKDYLRLPDDGNRYEVIRGVLYVTASPTWKHQSAGSRFERRLAAFVERRKLGEVGRAPFDVKLPFGIASPVQPDLVFFRKGNTPGLDDNSFEGVPDLVVEILSPRTRRRDLTVKLDAYRDAGVPEYWLVDPAERTVVVYVLEKGRYTELVRGGERDVVWSSFVPGFRIKVRSLFPPRAERAETPP
jgi:Uma2 family endonuclease